MVQRIRSIINYFSLFQSRVWMKGAAGNVRLRVCRPHAAVKCWHWAVRVQGPLQFSLGLVSGQPTLKLHCFMHTFIEHCGWMTASHGNVKTSAWIELGYGAICALPFWRKTILKHSNCVELVYKIRKYSSSPIKWKYDSFSMRYLSIRIGRLLGHSRIYNTSYGSISIHLAHVRHYNILEDLFVICQAALWLFSSMNTSRS